MTSDFSQRRFNRLNHELSGAARDDANDCKAPEVPTTSAGRDWWLGVTLVALAILLHGLIPRYEWREFTRTSAGQYGIRIDRWTGEAQRLRVTP